MKQGLKVGQTADVVESLVDYYDVSKRGHYMVDSIFRTSKGCINIHTDLSRLVYDTHVMYRSEVKYVGKLTVTKVK